MITPTADVAASLGLLLRDPTRAYQMLLLSARVPVPVVSDCLGRGMVWLTYHDNEWFACSNDPRRHNHTKE